MFEMLVLGLVLFCVEGQETECPLPGDTGAHVLMVNATATGPGCDAGSRKCTPCAGDKVDLHTPVLAVARKDVKATSFGDISSLDVLTCKPFADRIDVKEFACWAMDAPDATNLSITLKKPAQEPGLQPDGSGSGEHPGLGCVTGFRWVAPVSMFDSHYSEFRSNLGPASEAPVVAWLSLPNFGVLEAALLGHNTAGRHTVFTLWKDESGHGNGQKRALAEGVVWKTEVEGSEGAIRFESTSGAFVEVGRKSRAVLANLPGKLFHRWTRGPGNPRPLNHFRLYYNLFKEPASHAGCGVPGYVSGGPSVLERFPLENWLRGRLSLGCRPTKKPSPEVLKFFDTEGRVSVLESTQTALCPPSKYP